MKKTLWSMLALFGFLSIASSSIAVSSVTKKVEKLGKTEHNAESPAAENKSDKGSDDISF